MEELEDGKEHCEMLSCGSGMDVAFTNPQQLWPAQDVQQIKSVNILTGTH